MVTLRLLVAETAADGSARAAYAFKHAITRQVTYDLMPFAQRRELHTAVAEHQEAAAGEHDHALLAHHWSEAGVAGKAFDYFVRAGEDAARADANPEAAHLYARALTLDLTVTGVSPDEIALRRAHCHRRFGELSFALGALDKANESVEASFALLEGGRHRAPGRVTSILAQATVQVTHLILPRTVESSDPFRRRWHEERSKTAGLLALLKATPLDTVGMLGATLLSLNAAERAGTTNVFGLGMLGYAAQALGLRRQAKKYFARARAKAFELNELSVYFGLAAGFESMARFGAGDHVRLLAERRVDLQTARDIGDRRGVARGAAILGAAGGFTLTVHTDELLAWVADTLEANRDQPGVEQAYFLNLKAVIWSMFFRPEQAASHVVPLIDQMNASLERAPADAAALCFAVQALFYTRLRDLSAAAVVLDRALSWLRQNLSMAQATGWTLFQGTTEPSLAIYREAVATNRGVAEAARRAKESVDLLRRYARRHAIYRARWEYFAGVLASLEKQHAAARRHWESGLATAQRLSLELDEGLARLALAEADGGTRSEHLARAREIFTTRGAPYFVDRVDTIATLSVERSGT
jgi:tetratricopeptide (TPR) repeat protein